MNEDVAYLTTIKIRGFAIARRYYHACNALEATGKAERDIAPTYGKLRPLLEVEAREVIQKPDTSYVYLAGRFTPTKEIELF